MEKRDIAVTFRITNGTKNDLEQLAIEIGKEIGTKVTKTQVIEIAIREALESRLAK